MIELNLSGKTVLWAIQSPQILKSGKMKQVSLNNDFPQNS